MNLRCRTALGVFFLAPLLMAATTPVKPSPATPAHKAAQKPAKRSAAQNRTAKTGAAPPAALPETPKAPEAPKWPANDRPAPATITWDSQGLRIEAVNASLSQILMDVETATGARVTGMGDDERVFGVYGPGLARDVLSQLLHGSSYNVLMIGDLGKGAPRQIVLSARGVGNSNAVSQRNTASSEDDDSTESEPEEPPQPITQPVQPVVTPGGPPRAPQQMRPPQP